jgi:Clostripain family
MAKGWTILFFICEEDQETKSYAQSLLDDLLGCKTNPDLNLVCYESIRKQGLNGPLTGTLSLLEFNVAVKSREKKILKDFGVVDPGNASVLGNALEFLSANRLLLDRLLLFTWDHGAGFGIFSGDPRDRNESGHHRLHLHPGPRLHMLTSAEIGIALGRLGRKTDLVIMMNCWTQMLETGYEIADRVKLLVAPETADYFAGYDYRKIIDKVADSPDVDNKELAQLAVDSVATKFKESPAFKDDIQNVVITAAKLDHANELVDALDGIAGALISKIKTQFKAMSQLRAQCLDFTKGDFVNAQGRPDNALDDHYIDLLHFVRLLTRAELISKASADRFAQTHQKYVLGLFRGKKYDENESGSFGEKTANGVSIYHPDEEVDFQSIYYQYFYLSKKIKLASSQWANYLEAYKRKRSQ